MTIRLSRNSLLPHRRRRLIIIIVIIVDVLSSRHHFHASLLPQRAQRALGTWHLALSTGYLARRHANRHRKRLERRLGAVVVVLAAQAVHMQRQPGALRKTLQTVRDHLAAQVANLFASQPQLDHAIWTVREVDDGSAECLVEGGVGVAEAGQAGHGGEGRSECRAEGDADVFGGVVVVDYQRKRYRQ